MNKKERFISLLQQLKEGTISVAEQDELFNLMASHEYDTLLEEQIAMDLQHREPAGAGLPPHISQEIMRNILSAEKITADIIPLKRNRKTWYWTAAAVILVMALSGYFILSKNNTQKSFAEVIPHNILLVENTGSRDKTIELSDGSKITLEPNSILHYPKNFSDSTREIYFEGQAFFEISHNPKKPFLVYSNRIVTRVLGTSFFINTNTPEGNEEVSVRTGKVQVSENEKIMEKIRPGSSIIITPNQKAIYEPEKRLFETTLVEKPQPLIKEENNIVPVQIPLQKKLVFEQEKLQSIFHQLEDLFGVEIIPENPNLNNCAFTGDVSDEDLFTILKTICLSTRSSYVVYGTKILIKGQGCD